MPLNLHVFTRLLQEYLYSGITPNKNLQQINENIPTVHEVVNLSVNVDTCFDRMDNVTKTLRHTEKEKKKKLTERAKMGLDGELKYILFNQKLSQHNILSLKKYSSLEKVRTQLPCKTQMHTEEDLYT